METKSSRRLVYGVIIAVAVAAVLGRVFSAQLVLEPSQHKDVKSKGYRVWPKSTPLDMPTFSSNDRSRWATARALVEEGTFVVGARDPHKFYALYGLALAHQDAVSAATAVCAGYTQRLESDTGVIFQPGYQSVDKVLHPDKLEFLSSKPPLLAGILAGIYSLLYTAFGWTLAERPYTIVRIGLVVVNVLPFALYLHFIARWVERLGKTDWGRFYVLGAAAFGTFVTPFLVTINNHTIAAFSVMFALACVLETWLRQQEWRAHILFESPNCWRHFAGAGFFSAFAVANELPALSFLAVLFVLLVTWSPKQFVRGFLPAAIIPIAAFLWTNQEATGQWRTVQSDLSSPFYQYEGGHFLKPAPGEVKYGIDWAGLQETRADYALHLLVGHHGFFSLTPVWILAGFAMLGGTLLAVRRARAPADYDLSLPWFIPPMTLLISAAVIGFYLWKTDNYGGFTIGPRWLMWLTPLWLLCLIPAADWMAGDRVGRLLGYLFLGASIFSAHYSPWNPWRHPWIYDLMIALGWEGY